MAAITNVKDIESMIEVPAAASAQYRKVDREAKVGDVIRFDDESGYVTRGGYYEVVRIDGAGDPQILDNDGDEFDLCGEKYEVYEKVTADETDELFTHGGVQYRKVERRAKIGELCLRTKRWVSSPVGSVTKVARQGVMEPIGEDVEGLFPGYYVVLEPVKSAEPPQPTYLTIGDYAKVVRDDCGHGCEVGTFVKIVVDDGHYEGLPYRAEKADGTFGGWMYVADVIPATKADYDAAVEAEAERAKWAAIGREVNEYKAGDIVEITYQTGRLPVGTIGIIGEVDCDRSFRVNTFDVRSGNWYGCSGVRLITPVEQRFDQVVAS